MKTLFLLLLICFVNINAQTERTETGYEKLCDTTPRVNFCDSLIKDYPLHKTILGIILVYDQYERECYADSIRHEELKPCYSLVYPPCSGHSYNPPRYYWTHKETSFEGFIAWLRKQSNK